MHLGAALRIIVIEVELLIGLGGFTAYQTLINISAIVKPQINKTNEEIIQAHGTAILNIFSMIS